MGYVVTSPKILSTFRFTPQDDQIEVGLLSQECELNKITTF